MNSRKHSRNIILPLIMVVLAFVTAVHTGYVPSVQATTSTSWNTRIQCTPLIVRITDITANHTGSASFSASPFTPGITTSVTGGVAKRWLTPGPTPPGWASPGPSCTVTNSNGIKSVFVEIDGIERSSLTTEDSATSYDATNGGTSHQTTSDTTTNLIDPAIVPNYDTSCTSPSDPTCYGRIHGEIDHDWKAAGYCGSGTACDDIALGSQTSRASTKIDVQGFIYWDPGRETSQGHNYNGWEIHPLTGWRLHQSSPDFTVSTNPSSLSFGSGATGSFTVTISSQNGFTSSVTISKSINPTTGLSVGCSPTNISGGSGSSTCILNSSTPRSYTVTVTGTSGSLVHSAVVSVTVTQPPTPDFGIAANPATLSIVRGSSGTSTINLSSINGYSGTVTLSASISPSGPITNLNPTSIILGSNGVGSSTLSVTSGTAPLGSYTVNVTGTSGSLFHSVILTVSITGQPDFTISASPSSLTLGQTTSATITPVTVTSSNDRTWFESSYLADSFFAQGLIWMFYEDTSVTCENQSGCLLYATSSTGSIWATPTNVNVHVTDSDFSVYTDGTNVYYARYNELTFQTDCGRNVQFRTGSLVGASGTINWQPEQTALKAGSTFTYQNEEIIVDSNGQAWIAFLSDSRGSCGGGGTELPQVIHSSGTNYASWTTPTTLSTAHSNNWHVALASLGAGQIYAAYWLGNSDMHGKLYNSSTWGADEQISATTTKNDVNAWLFNSGTNLYAVYFDNNPETFNFATRSPTGTWTSNVIGVGESRTGTSFSSSYYAFPDAASYDPTHNKFYLFWMNATNQRIDEWTGSGNSWTKTTKLIGTTATPYPDSITSFITSSPTNSLPTTGGIFYVSGSSAPFTYNFAALPLGPSSTGTSTITVTSQNGFTGTVTLATSVNPSTRLNVTCSPTTIPGGSGSSTCTLNSTTPGNYNVTVTGTSGNLSHSTIVYVSVSPSSSPDYAISASPTSATVNAGTGGTSTITIAPMNGFSGTVSLTVTTNSTSLSCTLSSLAITGGSGSSTLSCTGSPAGNYLATVTGTSSSLSHSTAVTYHVQDFKESATPTTVAVTVNTPGASSISVTPLSGFSGTVTLAISTNSTNLVCTLSATTITGGSGSSTLSCSSSVAGNYLATITGTSTNLSHSAGVVYHVANAPDFTVNADPTSVTVNVAAAANSTMTVAPLNGFTGTVSLGVTTNSTNLVCSLSATSITGGSGSSTLTCTGSSAGNYLATITGTRGTISHSATVIYHIIGSQDFTLSANPTSLNIPAGSSGTSTITLRSLNGFSGTLSVSASVSPSGPVASLSPASVVLNSGGTGIATLNVTTSSGMLGSYMVNINATSGTFFHSISLNVTVTSSVVTINTALSSTSIRVGQSVVDSASLQGATANASGTVTYFGYGVGNCGAAATVVSVVPVTNRVIPNSRPVVFNFTGSFSFQANYSGDTNNPAAISPCEPLTVNPGPPNLTTSLSATAIIVGGPVTDSASLTTSCTDPACGSEVAASGTVTYSVFANGLCTGAGTPVSIVSVINNGRYNIVPNSRAVAFNSTGTFAFNAAYGGDTNGNAAVRSPCEPFAVNETTPTITTILSSSTITAGGSVTDSATLTSAFQAGGTVTYALFSTKDCSGTSTIVSTVTVTNSAVPNSASRTFNTPGNYCWNAVYSGDTNNNGTTSVCEPLVVNSSTTTLPSYALVVSYEGFVYKLYPNGTLSLIGQPVTSQLRAVSWKPDGSYALIVGDHAVLIKYDGTSLTTIPTGIATTVNFLSISWRPDGSYALVGGSGGILLKYDGATVTQIPSSYAVSFRAISWNPSGTQALLVSYFGQVFQYQSTGQLTKLNSGASQSFDAVAWSPDGSYALIAGEGGGILRYDGTTFQALNTAGLYSSTLTVRFISFNPAGTLALLVGDSGLVLTYNGSTLSALPTLTSNTLYSVSWAAGTAYIAGGAGTMLTYSGGTLTNSRTGTFSGFRGIAWKPN
ncbi:MAG TPA: WD40 repeat domain-containing protein [Candidatus Bathyarchaeia archaeon]